MVARYRELYHGDNYFQYTPALALPWGLLLFLVDARWKERRAPHLGYVAMLSATVGAVPMALGGLVLRLLALSRDNQWKQLGIFAFFLFAVRIIIFLTRVTVRHAVIHKRKGVGINFLVYWYGELFCQLIFLEVGAFSALFFGLLVTRVVKDIFFKVRHVHAVLFRFVTFSALTRA